MCSVCSIELGPCRGGTKIESWSSTDALDACGIPPNVNENDPQHSSSALWNAMMHPFTRHNAYGGLWYQGKDLEYLLVFICRVDLDFEFLGQNY